MRQIPGYSDAPFGLHEKGWNVIAGSLPHPGKCGIADEKSALILKMWSGRKVVVVGQSCVIFMTTFTESTWAVVPANESVSKLMKTYVEYPPRKLQSETYTGPITISKYQLFKSLQGQLAKEGFSIGLPTGN